MKKAAIMAAFEIVTHCMLLGVFSLYSHSIVLGGLDEMS
jgi:hypothetical protein